MSDEKLRELPSFQADQIKTLYNKITALENTLFELKERIDKLDMRLAEHLIEDI